MDAYQRPASLGKAISNYLLSSAILMSASAQAAVSQIPLSLAEGVAPNIIFTLDDSTSMNLGYTPNAIEGARHERKGKSAFYNLNYYNPSIQYKAPTSFSEGSEKKLETSFTKAYFDGFQPDKNEDNDWSNLETGYNVTWTYNRSKDGNGSSYTADDDAARNSVWGKNPASDFSCEVSASSSASEASCTTKANIIIKIKTGSNCEAISDSLPGEGSCSRSSDGTNRFLYKASWESRPVKAYYYEYDSSLTGCNGNKSSENCYKLTFVKKNEENNFAIWYSFYRTRALATISAASLAFYGLSPSIRMTWQSLIHCKKLNNTDTSTGIGYHCGKNSFLPFSQTHRENFFGWLQTGTRFDQADGTPLRWATKRAGDFLSANDSIAWHKNPGKSDAESKTAHACRPSYHVLMTDGMWTDTNEPSDVTKFANTDGNYTPPYSDPHSSTLADIAMHYWATDLASNIDNKVPAYIPYKNADSILEHQDPRNNPATWQHMVNFIMGLGLTEALNIPDIPWQGSAFEGKGYQNLKSGSANWPKASTGSNDNIYDLWHAAINSRGEFFSIENPDVMVQAFDKILARIASQKSTVAAPGVSNYLETDTTNTEPSQDRLVSYSYQSSFDNTEDWIGELKLIKSWRQWVADDQGGGSFESHSEDVWQASAEMPSEDKRNIKIANPESSKLQDFKTSNASEQLKTALNINPEGGQDGRWEERLNYLRGDRSNEGEEADQFRIRTHLLGDLLGSKSAVIQRAHYLPFFADKLEGNTKYSAFAESNKTRAGRIYIGGNDGMLHAFDTSNGVETFAFIPTAVFPNLSRLTGKNYTHHYYVDGSPEVADVYDHDSGLWKTILVGTLRAGGKGLFALDITDPDEIKLLWELDEFNYTKNAGFKKNMVGPGYSFPQPTIARLHNGRWAVVTGNGYEGANTDEGEAALYVIDAITGKLEKSLEVKSADERPNGLSSPRLADYDGDGVADYAYAGDLHGNLWRFDLFGSGAGSAASPVYGNNNSASVDDFKVSYGGKPLFTAKSSTNNTAQPVTAAPSLTQNPTGNGYLVIFGTGKYFELDDKNGTESHAQTLYAIWDDKTKAETTSATGMPIARNMLVQQTITQTDLGAKGLISGLDREARTISDHNVSYNSGDSAKKGWYLDLAHGNTYEGEMLIENMRVLGRHTLLISTLVPNDDPCAHGASNWLYALNPVTGGRTRHHAFDTRIKNPDGTYTLVSAIKLGSEGGLSLGQDELGITAFNEQIYPDDRGRLRGNRAGSWRMIQDP